MARCLSQFHCKYGPQYDGRLEVLWKTEGSRMERCKVCGHEFLTQAPSPDQFVQSEIEDWRQELMSEHNARRIETFKP